jgi:hypothetical protein
MPVPTTDELAELAKELDDLLETDAVILDATELLLLASELAADDDALPGTSPKGAG